MIIMICVGCVIGIAGLVIAAVRASKLMKAAQAAGINSRADLQEVTRRVQELAPRIEETSRRAQVTAANLQSLSVEAEKLNYLKKEFDEATGIVLKLKS
jgi:hypothetical protein